jgi:lipopolysaccharide transport system permease protein
MEPPHTIEPIHDVSPARDVGGTLPSRAALPLPEDPIGIRQTVEWAWRERKLAIPLGIRFLSKFTKGTKLGRLWLGLRPFMDVVGKSLLFGGVLKVSTGSHVPYYLFLTSGLIGWRLFERSLMYGARSFAMYRRLMKTFHLPLLLVPVAAMSYPLLETAVYLLVFGSAVVVFLVSTGILYLQPPPQLLLAVVGLALVGLITLGALLWISVLNAKARDVRYLMRYVLPVGLYATPVVYPLSKLPAEFRWVGFVNPLSAPIEMIKYGLVGSGIVELAALAGSLSVGLALIASGLWYFSREAARSIEAADDDADDTV